MSDLSPGTNVVASAVEHNRCAALQEMVATFCSDLVTLRADQFERYVYGALQKIAALFELDRSLFYRMEDSGLAYDRIEWVRDGFKDAPDLLDVTHEFPWALDIWRRGETLCFSHVEDVPSTHDREGFRALSIRSLLSIPIFAEGRRLGAVGFATMRAPRQWLDAEVKGLTLFARMLGAIVDRRQRDRELSGALENVRRLTDRLEAENIYLRNEVADRRNSAGIIGESPVVMEALDQARQVAATDSTVLLLGETGTGKSLFAAEIHRLGPRHRRPMISVLCPAIPPSLIESELFGHEKGAFPGAEARQIGRFELADQSTIFLDEVGDLSADMQVRLLRVLEERRIDRMGNPRPIAVDARVIAATHLDLPARVAAGAFREDLYYRLNVFPIRVPALRERPEDIPLLVRHFVAECSGTLGKQVDGISTESLAALRQYAWPGNIRELRNVVERAMIGAPPGGILHIRVPDATPSSEAKSLRLQDVERHHIRHVLATTNWRIRGAGGAAEQLGLKPTTLESRLLKLGLRRESRGR